MNQFKVDDTFDDSQYYNDVSLLTSLESFMMHPGFIAVIQKKYLTELPLELMNKLASAKDEEVAKIHEELLAISHFRKFINTILSNGQIARSSLIELHNAESQ